MTHLSNIRKLFRYAAIYGLHRTLFKAAGRLRRGGATLLNWRRWTGTKDIAVIGCGQFAFATIGYVLTARFGKRIGSCFDVDVSAASTFAKFFGVPRIEQSAEDIFSNPAIRIVYVASNHASHTDYSIQAIDSNKIVYVEKPVSVDISQFHRLAHAVSRSRNQVCAGYNRPCSSAIRKLMTWCDNRDGPLTLSCFVSGHSIPENHWYRLPEEGTRVCGNVGHWLDLMVHVLSWGELPDCWRISLTWSDQKRRDDDLVISLTSDRGDLVNILLTARCEPFEGINETINLQWGSTIAKIDDFRRMTVWKEEVVKNYRFWPKDVGHVSAILQPFRSMDRNWHEVELSTLLMLKIAEMVVNGQHTSPFSFAESWMKVSPEITQKSLQSIGKAT